LDKKTPEPQATPPETRISEGKWIMQLQLTRLFEAGSLPEEAVPYSSAALRHDLERVRNAWDDCQASRDRNAIY
jgi:hypothetical protein